ncbi:MAG: PEF-CTERM sorting domain-containing protein [Methanolobus sp.]|nr:PEF-CTERM sorting domain-containing protein [Methanolobus sp.]
MHNGHVTIYKYGYYCPITPIPEFPTVALPVAAILGLAFLFQRKEK